MRGSGQTEAFLGIVGTKAVEVPDLRLSFSEMRDTASVAFLCPLGGLLHGSFFLLREHF